MKHTVHIGMIAALLKSLTLYKSLIVPCVRALLSIHHPAAYTTIARGR